MEALAFYAPAAVAATAFLCRLPGLARSRRDPLTLSAGGLLLIAAGVFFFAAPSTIAAVNDLTGVPNFSAPLVYSVLTAFCACCLILVINWRGGDPRTVRRATRCCLVSYTAVIVALVVLFALADAPVERLRDLDTYYANTPCMREMIVLYLTAHSIAVVATSVLCWRWVRQIHGWLRAGVVLMVAGYLLNIVYDAVKFAAVSARWSGRDWDWLSTDVAPPVASLSGMVIGIGFLLPMAGERASSRWQAHRTYRRLEPLWRELRIAAPGTGTVRMRPWAPPELLLTQRRADIHDGLLLLTPHFDADVRRRAHEAALRQGATRQGAAAIADAALAVAAVRAKTGRRPSPGRGSGGRPSRTFVRDDPFDLVEVSGALHHPVVADVLGHPEPAGGADAP
ncbi:hypothetical protein N566_07935 [Streptomycetaceae bacterium MP113-05]|nr:hypothetical protein N566_07935 [Streptomycetaceae bacterium MP113-05]